MDEKDLNPHFVSLVMMLASACWQQLGKIANPVTGKVEKEVAHAQITLDLLMMLREKTKGNLTPEEDRLIGNTIADLQLNFSDDTTDNSNPIVN
jgi:hypothetical protein